MNSLTYKLACIFLAMSLVPLIIGINAALSMRTAGAALEANDKALKHLSTLLSAAGESMSESTRMQDNASQVSNQVASAQQETSASLRDMGNSLLPRTFAMAQIRFALADASSAERGLLLALNMRHLKIEELAATREQQLRNMDAALKAIDDAVHRYEPLIGSDTETQAWLAFVEALNDWRANHNEFMREIAGLDRLVEDMVRGGPLFASSSRKAYDTIFVQGRATREACENRIDVLNQTLARVAEVNVRDAMQSQQRSQELLTDLGRDTSEVTARSLGLQEQIEQARQASQVAAADAASALDTTLRRFRLLVIFSVLLVAAAVVAGIILSWRISRPIRDMARHLSRVARGEVTGDVPAVDQQRNDEIGQLARALQDLVTSNRLEIGMANAMAMGDYTSPIPLRSDSDQLGWALRTMLSTSNDTLTKVSRTVERVSYGSQMVADASHSLSQGAQTSAQAVEQISQTAIHVDSQAKDNAQHARQANVLATGSREAARRGYKAVSELVSAMGEIQASGKKIASVAKLIDDIAFQTNLLALNAAVEAARAGRQGKGFSVVAEEVRNLSGRSARAARETSAMVAAMTGRMEAGADLAERSDNEFREIVEATSKVAQIFEDITAASNAQSDAMAQISQGLAQIDEVIQENTHNASRTASSAQALERMADELRQMVERFRLISDKETPRAALPGSDARMILPLGAQDDMEESGES